ncbi:TonB-dependent receptor [Pedobacter boryungensis]|uniref:TonB-dependent receptor n=1 Tax=Pedobacter boryungensis TaxID=869962 RepID=A0ABX2DFZ2_9SPHI|nr:TonB-dependent receptor [Pedobacter boryungensis]NQX31886.1 TonB-dependent receptor [Pedobacter boryungensis]
MKLTIKLCLLLLIGVITLSFRKDIDPFLELLKRFETFTSTYPQEKVYIQFDKPYYAVGDDIWLKAYVLNTKSQEPSQLSGMLDIELIDEMNRIKASIKLPLNKGAGWGDFSLPDSLIEGNYRIRAYTPYMRNFSSDFFFEKNIKIGKSWSNNVFVNTNFSYRKDKNIEKTIASIRLNDQNEKPYQNKSVGYEVFSGVTVVDKGWARTDAAGNVEIAFSSPNSTTKAGTIKLEISIDRNKTVSKTIAISSFATNSDVQFFPEGGQLVEDHPQRIAIKATDPKGHGIDVTGNVVDESGTLITSFRTDYIGMGSFVTQLQADKKYFADVRFTDGSQKKVQLPAVSAQGYTLSVNNMDATNLSVRVTASTALANGGEIKIVGQQAGNIRFVLSGKLNSQTLVATLPKKKFTAGITQITIFSPDNKPVAERLVFIKQPSDILELKIDTSGLSHAPSGKSHIKFTAGELGGSFSVSVTNSDLVAPDLNSEGNILTSLLLTGDLVGYIEKPNHYFLNDDQQTNRELDNLMMTQGWRRFSWQDVIENNTPTISFKPETAIAVSGKVVNGKKVLSKIPVFLMSKNGGNIVRDTLTDKEGKFNFDQLVFKDSLRFLVQASPLKKGSFLELRVDEQINQAMTYNRTPAEMDPNVNSTLKKYVGQSEPLFRGMEQMGFLKKTIQLNTVTITTEKRQKHFENSANLNGPGNADQTITADELPPYYSLLDLALGNMIHGVKIIRGKAYLIRNYRGWANTKAMALYVNGTRYSDSDLSNIMAMDVQAVEVLTSPGKVALYDPNDIAIILVTTKRGPGYSSKKPARVDFNYANIQPKGFYTARKFYVPQYNQDGNNIPADYRTTVFWDPNIIKEEKGIYDISFFNTKAKGNYRVVIEGMNKIGQLSRVSFNYQVKSGI